MNIKRVSILAILVLSGLSPATTVVAQTPGKEFKYLWDLNKLVTVAGGVAITEKESGNSILVPDGKGISLVPDSKVPGGKALVFDGSQTEAISTISKLSVGQDIRITVMVMPEDNPAGASWQTVFYMFKQCELRYKVASGILNFIVWHSEDGKSVTEVGVPILSNQWNTVEATVLGSSIELKVNGRAVPGTIPGDGRMNTVESVISLGNATNRPLIGRIAELVVSTPKFN